MNCQLLHKSGCGWCGRELKGRQTRWCSRKCSRAFTANHRWTQAKAAKKAAVTLYRCERCGDAVERIEIHHLTPVLGKHGLWGCHHHAEGLLAVCHDCHLELTAEQRAANLFNSGNKERNLSSDLD